MNIALYVVLGLSVLVDLALGAWAGVAWGSFVSTFHLNFADLSPEALRDTQLLGLVLGFCLLCFAALQALAFYWIRAEKEEGHRLVILFGGYLIVSSVVTFVVFPRMEFLLLDGLRGGLLAVFAVLALNSPATVRELRLPDASARPGRRDDERKGGEFRSSRGGPDRERRDRRGPGRSSRTRPPLEDDRLGGRRRRGGREEGRTPSARRDRPQPRDEEEPRDKAEFKDRLRPLISNVGPVPETPPAREASGTGGRRGRVPEDREPERARPPRMENRARTPAEIISHDVPVRRPHPEEPEEQPLTVVVRGEPDLRLRSRPILPEVDAPEAEPVARPEQDGMPPSGDRRRRRRRRPRGGRGMDDRTEVAGAEFERDLPEETGPEPSPRHLEPELERPIREPELEREPASPDEEHSSAYVEALDKLSLLEPHPQDSPQVPMEYGRTRKPVARKRPLPSTGPVDREREGPRGGSSANPAAPARDSLSRPSSDSTRTGPRPVPADPESSRLPWPADPVRQNDEEDAGGRGEDS